jgi:membrane-associated phospholipid phosphatase
MILAGSTGLARMSKNRHWLTDVLAGSAIGFIMAHQLTRIHQDQQRASGDPPQSSGTPIPLFVVQLKF